MVKRYDMEYGVNKFHSREPQVVPVQSAQGAWVSFEDYAVLELKLCLAKQAYDRLHQVHLAAMELWRQETEGQ